MRNTQTRIWVRITVLGCAALLLAAGFLFVLRESGKTDLFAASITWDGGGDGVNWTDDANWVGDVEPGSGDVAVFDGTNTNNVTIDASINVQGIDINAGYTGTITQGAGNTVTVGTGDFDISAGTFTGSDATIDMNDQFTVSGGTFNSTTGELQVAGNFTVSSGAFNPSTGTVVADGSGNRTWDVVTTETFYNFTINKTSNGDVDVSGDTFVITNDLSNLDGNLDGGTYEVQGNIIQGVNGDTGAAIIDFANDSLAQTLTVNGGTIPQLRLNSAADASDSIVINAAATFTNLIITSGFSGTVPISNGSDFTLTFTSIDMDAGTLDGSGDTLWNIVDIDKTAGTLNLPTTVVASENGHVTWTFDTTPTFTNFTLNKGSGWRLDLTAIIVTGDTTFTNGRLTSGTIDARGDISVAATFDDSPGIVDFGNDAVSQTFTINGGLVPQIRLDSAADASDSIVITAAAYFDNLIVTSGFSGTVPWTNSSDVIPTFESIDLDAGTLDASGDSQWDIIDIDKTGGTFNHPPLIRAVASGQNPTWSFDVAPTFTNFTMAGGNGWQTLIPTINVSGTTTLTDGRLMAGTLNAFGDITQASTFDNSSATLNFANDAVAQTYTINGGVTPVITLDSAADANDDIDVVVNPTFNNLVTTAGFSGTVPLNNPSDFVLYFDSFDIGGGTLDGSGDTEWQIVDADSTGSGVFIPPPLVTAVTAGFNTWDFAATQEFTNLTVDKPNGWRLFVPNGERLVVNNDLILNNGRVMDGTIEVKGDMTVNAGYDNGTTDYEFSGSNVQTFDTSASTDTINGTLYVNKTGGQLNQVGNLVMDQASQDFYIQEGVYDLNGYALTVSGSNADFDVEDGGTLQLFGSETLTLPAGDPDIQAGSTIVFTGDGDASSDTYTVTGLDTVFANLTINSTDGATDTFDLGAAVDLSGDFTLTTGTFETNGNQMNVAGDWANTGTFQAEGNEVVFDGTSQSISGTTTFNDFSKQVSSADTITFPSTLTQNILGALTLEGASGELLTIDSSTPSSAAIINPTGTVTVNFLDVADNTNSSGTNIECYNGCVDSGGNSGWLFTPPVGTQVTLDVDNVAPQILPGTEKLCDNSGGIANNDAAITACADLSAVDLTAGSTLSVSFFVKARDNNSSSDIAATGQEATYYHSANASPTTSACTSDNNNCYQVVDGIRAAIIDATDVWLRYDMDLEYYTDSSAGAPSWLGFTQVEDAAGLTDDNAGGEYSNEINSLVAVTFPDVAYGSISLPFTSSAANNVEITHQNNGNVIVDMDVGLNTASLTCSGNGSIPVSNIKFDDSDLAFGSMSKTLTQSPTLTDMDLNIAQRTNDSAPQLGTDQEVSYWGLEVLSDALGSCSGTVNVTSYQGS